MVLFVLEYKYINVYEVRSINCTKCVKRDISYKIIKLGQKSDRRIAWKIIHQVLVFERILW